MFALVSFSFAGGTYSKKSYLFKTEVDGLNKGDFVIVEGPTDGKNTIAMFLTYVEEDRFPQFERKWLLKKAHGNTLKSLIKKRKEMISKLEFHENFLKHFRENFPEYDELDDNNVFELIYNRLVVSPKTGYVKTNVQFYFYDRMQIVVKNGKITTARKKDERKTKPRKQLEQYV